MDSRDEGLLATATDYFERRLAEELGKVRVEIADLRTEVRTGFAEVRGEFPEMRAEMSGFRGLFTASEDKTTHAMGSLRLEVRADLANLKTDMLRWMFLFWVGQVAVVFGLATLLH